MIKIGKEQFKRALNLILIWVLVAVVFGIFYYLLPGELTSQNGQPITNLFDAIYFSFVTMLTIGYGDIVPHGLIRVLTAIEGLIGWVLFGVIVYKIVSVKEDVILKEIHNLSNEQYLSRIKNFLFISNTNLVRFIKEVQSKKFRKDAAIYELGIISTTLRSNIEDASRFLCRKKKNGVESDLEEEDLLILVKSIKICIANFVNALKVLPKDSLDDPVIRDNKLKIIEFGDNIYTVCNISPNSSRLDDLKLAYTKLEDLDKGGEK